MDDTFSFLIKLKRYTQTSATLAGLATRIVAQNTTPYTINDEAYAKALKETLGSLKGPFMKIAQFLATIPHALPEEYMEAFLELQAHAPAMGPFFVKRRMQTELGVNWEKLFAAFDEKPAFAASLGQVHKAITSNGTSVAVKLQYANMQKAIEADLNQFKMAISAYGLFNKALHLDLVAKEINDRLLEELDYTLEASHLTMYHDFFKDDPHIHVPFVVFELSTSRLLTMEWIEGQSLLECAQNLSQDEKNVLGKTLFEAWYRPFYLKGWIHGDPHPGNYKRDADNRLCLLDFGCVRKFDFFFVNAVIDLYEALKNQDKQKLTNAYKNWGFDHLSEEITDTITQWAQLLYEPLLDDRIRPIQTMTTPNKGWDTAMQIHQRLNALGGIQVPQEFVFMDRAAVGIGSMLMRLGCQCNWHQIFEDILQERKKLGTPLGN